MHNSSKYIHKDIDCMTYYQKIRIATMGPAIALSGLIPMAKTVEDTGQDTT